MKKVIITTDGACLGNPGPGGWAALLKYGNAERMLSGSEAHTTNNRMEIRAVVEGLKELKESCQVQVVLDSRYVMDAFDKGWIKTWKANGWLTSDRKPVKNRDLWEELDKVLEMHRVSWTWVRGHNGHEDNERVDQEARAAALKASDSTS